MSAITQALQLATARALLPSALGSAELADLAASLEERAFWSARTTHAAYLAALKKLTERALQDGYQNDLPRLRIEARLLLRAYGYTPEQGFPGDAAKGVPAGTPGTLTDLSSGRRLNLIFDTQTALARGLGQKLRGLDRMDVAPAWELIRVTDKTTPRDWDLRWAQAADNVDQVGIYDTSDGRKIAHKTSPIWPALGSKALFDDALDVDHAPFAFSSGMGLREVGASELTDLPDVVAESPTFPAPKNAVPDYVNPDDFIGGQATLDRLLADWKARQS